MFMIIICNIVYKKIYNKIIYYNAYVGCQYDRFVFDQGTDCCGDVTCYARKRRLLCVALYLRIGNLESPHKHFYQYNNFLGEL